MSEIQIFFLMKKILKHKLQTYKDCVGTLEVAKLSVLKIAVCA